MNKEVAKKLAKVIVPLLLALGAAYGYVDQSCTCNGAPDAPAPAASE